MLKRSSKCLTEPTLFWSLDQSALPVPIGVLLNF